MKTLDLEGLNLLLYSFDEDEKIFKCDLIEQKTVIDFYKESSEVIKILKYLMKNNINFKEESNGNIKLVS